MNELLEERGWEELPPGELCWLDCARQALHKEWHHSEIDLCEPHALVLESGRKNATYAGALTPSDSVAIEWPWRRIARQLVDVV